MKKRRKRLLIIFLYISEDASNDDENVSFLSLVVSNLKKNKRKKKYAQKTHAKRHKRDGDDNDDDDDDDDAPCTRKPGDKTRIGTDQIDSRVDDVTIDGVAARSRATRFDEDVYRQPSPVRYERNRLGDAQEIQRLERAGYDSKSRRIEQRGRTRDVCGFFSVSDVIDPLVEAFEDEKKIGENARPDQHVASDDVVRKSGIESLLEEDFSNRKRRRRFSL